MELSEKEVFELLMSLKNLEERVRGLEKASNVGSLTLSDEVEGAANSILFSKRYSLADGTVKKE